jgi:hypothetical protein
MQLLTPLWFVRLWIAGFLVIGLSAQGVGRRMFAESTDWGYDAGWQTEILMFNLFGATMLLVILRHAPQLARALVVPLTALPLCLGLNHFHTALGAPGHTGNWMGAASNGFAVVFGALVWLNRKGWPAID